MCIYLHSQFCFDIWCTTNADYLLTYLDCSCLVLISNVQTNFGVSCHF